MPSHHGVRFLNSSTAKSAWNLKYFSILPWKYAATTACSFSTTQYPKVLLPWGVVCIFTSKCASRHNGVQLFMSHLILPDGSAPVALASLLLDPPKPQNIGKTQCFRDFSLLFLILSRPSIFFLLTLSSVSFSSVSFSSSTALTTAAASVHKSEVWLLNFLR